MERAEDRLHDLKEVKAGGEKETQLKWLLDIRIGLSQKRRIMLEVPSILINTPSLQMLKT